MDSWVIIVASDRAEAKRIASQYTPKLKFRGIYQLNPGGDDLFLFEKVKP